MKSKGHRLTTEMAIRVMKEVAGETIFSHENMIKKLVKESSTPDNYGDVEFVNVWLRRDNPHKDSPGVVDDTVAFSTIGRNHTAFNHYIDIAKGPGAYDDFDGYSYAKGSGKENERESVFELANYEEKDYEWIAKLAQADPRNQVIKVDNALAWFFNDRYVHAPGQPWYDNCSSAIESYSYWADKAGSKHFESLEEECISRFPLAQSTGKNGKGVPYSVFMPVDNMGRYWYEQCKSREWPVCMGPVLHAVQDASIPHHTAGTNGNWHTYYEGVLNENITEWNKYIDWPERAHMLMQEWNWQDPAPPTRLTMEDVGRKPAINWRVDHLITWVALQAYHDYVETYGEFKHFRERQDINFDSSQMFELTVKALAMSALLLLKVNGEMAWKAYIGNRSTRELHAPDCSWLAQIKEENRVEPLTIPYALSMGFNGCHYCMPSLDKD